MALVLMLTFFGSASPSAWEAAQARTPTLVPPAAPVAVTVEPEASVTPIVPGSAPAPAVHVVATGRTKGGASRADLADVLLSAYRSAVTGSPAACHLPVSLLAAIGEVESGSLVGRPLDREHRTSVLGPVLDGHGFAAVADTDDGRWDGDTRWDRAVGPMQILPGTWRAFGVDGDGDGVADPQDVEDATAGAADYLCFGGRDLADPAALRRAVLSYNHSAAYLHLVTTYAGRFAALGLDDPGTTGLPTRLSLVATALPGEAPAAPRPGRAYHDRSVNPKAPAAPKAQKAPAAQAPEKDQSVTTAAAETPAPAAPTSAAPTAAAPSAAAAAAPEAAPDASATPAPEQTAPDPAPDPGPDPTPPPEACPTAPVDDPATPEDESTATDDSTADGTAGRAAAPTAAPAPADEPAEDATPADGSEDPAHQPCGPCPDGVDPTVEQPCQPPAVATGPAPSSAP